MSNLLERMVQGIRAPHAGIEPLVQPIYAWQVGLGSRSWTERGGRPEPPAEKMTLAQAGPEPGSSHLAPLRYGRSADDREVQPQRDGNVADDDVSGPLVTAEQRSSFNPSGETSSVLQAGEQDRKLDQRAVASRAIPMANTSISAPATDPPKSASVAWQAPATRDQLRTSAADEIKKPVSEQPAMKQGIRGTPLPARQHEDTNAMRRSDHLLSGLRGGEKTSTQVTISIGHVEVRAEQPAERPRRAFRPRVSLSDFLNQSKPGRS